MSVLSVEEMSKVLDLACEMGREAIKNKSAPSYSDSTVSEEFLVDLLKKAMAQLGYDANLVNHHGGHAFPDVSITGSGVGIELKGASANRKFNGNSVVASTMLPNLKRSFNVLDWKRWGYRSQGLFRLRGYAGSHPFTTLSARYRPR